MGPTVSETERQRRPLTVADCERLVGAALPHRFKSFRKKLQKKKKKDKNKRKKMENESIVCSVLPQRIFHRIYRR